MEGFLVSAWHRDEAPPRDRAVGGMKNERVRMGLIVPTVRALVGPSFLVLIRYEPDRYVRGVMWAQHICRRASSIAVGIEKQIQGKNWGGIEGQDQNEQRCRNEGPSISPSAAHPSLTFRHRVGKKIGLSIARGSRWAAIFTLWQVRVARGQR